MLRIESKQLSLHSVLYNKIPKNHILKRIGTVVDFSFINELLAPSYCRNFGRPAKEPELMCKLLILQHLYNLSDERVIEEASLNLAYMYFLGLNPEDALPEKSLLAKFRCHRLEDVSLDEIISEVVRQCVEKGIIQSKSISMDATHTQANTIRLTPERLMRHLCRDIINTCEEETGAKVPFHSKPDDIDLIEEPKEIRVRMKDHLCHVMDSVEAQTFENAPETTSLIRKSKRILANPKFLAQKGVRSLVDEDARVGCKSKRESFFGYKIEYAMTTDENIITSVVTKDGAYTDGNCAGELIESTLKTGVDIKEVYADKAYFRKHILQSIEKHGAKAYIPLSHCVYRIDESRYTYNKDADQWMCSQGNITVDRKHFKKKQNGKTYEGYRYYFDARRCKTCPIHDECAKKTIRKILSVGLNTAEFYQISQEQKNREFIEKYKKRASIESKNAELKRFHGLARARGYGLKSISKQAKLTALAVNIKRIAALASSFFKQFVFTPGYISKIL